MKRRKFIQLATLACSCPSCLLSIVHASEKGSAHHWSYDGVTGPNSWGELSSEYTICGAGREQSPVDLTQEIPAMLGDVTPRWVPIKTRIFNNGHTVQIDCDAGSTVVVDGVEYSLIQFHFHHPSEHTINGKYFPMEVHFVHKGDAGLAVLGVMLIEGTANPLIDLLWQQFPNNTGERFEIAAPIMPAALLPPSSTTYRYAGSLTTPPCSEVVSWVVYHRPVMLSSTQINRFAGLFANNARPVQKLNRRKLLIDLF